MPWNELLLSDWQVVIPNRCIEVGLILQGLDFRVHQYKMAAPCHRTSCLHHRLSLQQPSFPVILFQHPTSPPLYEATNTDEATAQLLLQQSLSARSSPIHIYSLVYSF